VVPVAARMTRVLSRRVFMTDSYWVSVPLALVL
jgi:hypothetical protein